MLSVSIDASMNFRYRSRSLKPSPALSCKRRSLFRHSDKNTRRNLWTGSTRPSRNSEREQRVIEPAVTHSASPAKDSNLWNCVFRVSRARCILLGVRTRRSRRLVSISTVSSRFQIETPARNRDRLTRSWTWMLCGIHFGDVNLISIDMLYNIHCI